MLLISGNFEGKTLLTQIAYHVHKSCPKTLNRPHDEVYLSINFLWGWMNYRNLLFGAGVVDHICHPRIWEAETGELS